MKLVILTMVYNEKVNLPIWVRHYRRYAPSANLIVVDHCSDDGSTAHLPEVEKISLPPAPMDEWRRVRLINHLQRGLLQYFDLVIYTDCDELLVPDPECSSSLEAYLAAQTYEYAAPIGLNVLHMTGLEAPLQANKPPLAQRRYCQFHSSMCKPVISRIGLTWDPGFHTCDKPPQIDRNLFLFHTKTLDRDRALERHRLSRQVVWSEDAIKSEHGAHHRYDENRFIREFFLDRWNQLQKQGAAPFNFDAEVARLQEQTFKKSGIFHVPAFSGPLMEIPERFRDSL